MKTLILSAAAIALLSGCGVAEGKNGGQTLDQQTDVFRFPFGISDVGVTCDGADAVYSSENGGVYVVVNSARCKS